MRCTTCNGPLGLRLLTRGVLWWKKYFCTTRCLDDWDRYRSGQRLWRLSR